MYKRIVIKVGTKVLSEEGGKLDVDVLEHLVKQIVETKNKGVEVVLVTSGAVGAGRGLMTLKRQEKAAEKQVFAAIGQVKLMNIFPDKTAFGRGGMLTKFNTAKRLAFQGVTVHFVNGKKDNVIIDIISGKNVGTKFMPCGKSSNIKRRIAYSDGIAKGSVAINKCAEELLVLKTKIISLLPVGIVKVEGDFEKGDIIEIIGGSDRKLGFGIARYSSEKIKEFMGNKNGRPVIHLSIMIICLSAHKIIY